MCDMFCLLANDQIRDVLFFGRANFLIFFRYFSGILLLIVLRQTCTSVSYDFTLN